MTAALDRLAELIHPPAEPVAADGDWAAVEAEYGPVPARWKAFIRLYGSGWFVADGDVLEVFSPLDPAGRERIAFGLEVMGVEITFGRELDAAARARGETGPWWEDEPYPDLHPARPGGLPWGCNDQRAHFAHLTDLDPERWTTVCSVETRFRRLPCGMAEFLLGTLCRVGPSRWFDDPDVYVPRDGCGAFPDVRRVRFYTAAQHDYFARYRAEFPREGG
ncbi:MAG: hypothetical protein K2X82_33505 [Gemmataceae bacterium]|nr:hypothetical protein [Gemmataceae bacterium]